MTQSAENTSTPLDLKLGKTYKLLSGLRQLWRIFIIAGLFRKQGVLYYSGNSYCLEVAAIPEGLQLFPPSHLPMVGLRLAKRNAIIKNYILLKPELGH